MWRLHSGLSGLQLNSCSWVRCFEQDSVAQLVRECVVDGEEVLEVGADKVGGLHIFDFVQLAMTRTT